MEVKELIGRLIYQSSYLLGNINTGMSDFRKISNLLGSDYFLFYVEIHLAEEETKVIYDNLFEILDKKKDINLIGYGKSHHGNYESKHFLEISGPEDDTLRSEIMQDLIEKLLSKMNAKRFHVFVNNLTEDFFKRRNSAEREILGHLVSTRYQFNYLENRNIKERLAELQHEVKIVNQVVEILEKCDRQKYINEVLEKANVYPKELRDIIGEYYHTPDFQKPSTIS